MDRKEKAKNQQKAVEELRKKRLQKQLIENIRRRKIVKSEEEKK